MARRAAITCSEEDAAKLRNGQAPGVRVIEVRPSFERNSVDVLVESLDLPDVPEGAPWPRARLRNSTQGLMVALV